MNIKAHIPNLLTLINLGSGIVALFYLDMRIAIICLAVSLLADLADGAVARALGVDGPLGAILDSLADLVTFSVVPAVVTYHTLLEAKADIWIIIPLVLFVCMGCYRLARFVVNSNESTNFSGMPVPATALVIIGIWIYSMAPDIVPIPTWLLASIFMICGVLNVSTLSMLAFKGLGNSPMKKVFFLLIGCVSFISFIWNPYTALCIIMTCYVFLGIIFGLIEK